MNIHWVEWYWSWSPNILAFWCEMSTDWKRTWCWERLKAGGEGDNPGWDGWLASPTRGTWVWVGPGNWWWTGKPGVLQSMGWQRIEHDWVAELNWTETSLRKFSLLWNSKVPMAFKICVTFPFPMSFVITLITSCTFIIMVIFPHAYLDSLNR